MSKPVLEGAQELIHGQRASDYGHPRENFERIARFWSAYLSQNVTPEDVAAMMALFKLARIAATPTHRDSWLDLAGYVGCWDRLTNEP